MIRELLVVRPAWRRPRPSPPPPTPPPLPFGAAPAPPTSDQPWGDQRVGSLNRAIATRRVECRLTKKITNLSNNTSPPASYSVCPRAAVKATRQRGNGITAHAWRGHRTHRP